MNMPTIINNMYRTFVFTAPKLIKYFEGANFYPKYFIKIRALPDSRSFAILFSRI